MGYISAQQAATKWGISKRRVQVLCTENRIKNATRIGNMWVVPEDALKPADGRVQTHHTVESPTARAARTALKKLTVNAYQEINGKLNNPSTSKMVFVSLLATTIFCDIIQNAITTTISEIFRGDFRRICEVKKAVLHLEAIYFCHGTCYLLKRENNLPGLFLWMRRISVSGNPVF